MQPHTYLVDGRSHPPPPPRASTVASVTAAAAGAGASGGAARVPAAWSPASASSASPSSASPHRLQPQRRAHLPQPPLLRTTALANSNAHVLHSATPLSTGHGLTPSSATSLSTPFSQHSAASPYPASPLVAASPMAMRAPVSFSATPYNPQEWAHAGAPSSAAPHVLMMAPQHQRQTSQNVVYAPRLTGPDEPMVSPPPPYSAEPTASPDTTSPAVEFSHARSPTAVGRVDIESPVAPPTTARSPPMTTAAFPPPPPSSSRVRSTSRNHADRLLQAMNLRSRGTNPAPPPNAIDALHQGTSQLLHMADAQAAAADPPSARRAASTSALGTAYPSNPAYSVSPVQDRGAVLPPPPPGPPPPTARSQSAGRPSELSPSNAGSIPAPPAVHRVRQPVARGSDLGPVPPTPAGWQEDPPSPNSSIVSERQIQQPLRVETENLLRDGLTQSPVSGELSGRPTPMAAGSTSMRPRGDSGSLMRSPAVRNRSAQGLRERRSESRRGTNASTGDAGAGEGGDPLSRPLNVITNDTTLQRRASTRTTPRSGQFRGLDEALNSNDSGTLSEALGSSVHSTPRPDSSRQTKPSSNLTSPNTPYSAHRTGPPSAHVWRKSGSRLSFEAPSSADGRPISHILHMPNEENVQVEPLRPDSSQSLLDLDSPESPHTFADRAMERFHIFARQEASAANDSERLHLFTQFIVAESQLRRTQYAAVFRDEQVQVSELLEGMFETSAGDEPPPSGKTDLSSSATPQTARREPVPSMTGSRPSSGTSFADSSSHSRPVSSSSTSEPLHLTLDTSVNDPRSKSFVPALSPIASMSAVTGRDEMDSRGRAPSRWWESQSETSGRGEGFDVLKRSKRESKYMSAVLEHEALPSFDEIYRPAEASGSNAPPQYGPNEYPPEKVGWHEPLSSNQTTPLPPLTPAEAPYTPDPHKLDISRLITLPPPYPRHHPAVNNSHPDLADIRNTVRALSEFTEVDAAQEKFEVQIKSKRQRSDSWCAHQRSLHDQDMQFRIERGEITQAEYDTAEAALDTKLGQAQKDAARETFDLFQQVVVTPVLALLTERLSRADAAVAALMARLDSDNATHSPNLPQEAGDEQPELLEKLTMLKWLFEARETLHRTKHRVLTQRNDHYKQVILTPYIVDRNPAKLAEAEDFFASDARTRQAALDTAALHRWKELLAAIERHTTRGVEVQLSAFWDIAPPLQALLQRIPARLAGFQILVPRAEVDENPSYWTHPLRYLYSVLAHAEASSRQFVEAQVNLWCLLQEVREGCLGARWRARESQQREASNGRVGLADGDAREHDIEVRRGVDDLKERVGQVEEQWADGLGGAISGVRETVRTWLEETGGWDEDLERGE